MGRITQLQKQRLKQDWEQGDVRIKFRKSFRKGNPRYEPVVKNGKTVYVLRNKYKEL